MMDVVGFNLFVFDGGERFCCDFDGEENNDVCRWRWALEL